MDECVSDVRSGAFASPPDLMDPSGTLAAWWTDPPGVLVQFARPVRGTTAMAEWLVGPGAELLLRRFPEQRGLRVILDMRSMTGRSAVARSVLLQAAKPLAKRVGHVVLLPSLHMGAAYLKVIEGSAMVLRLTGMRVDVEQALDRVLDAHGVRAAGATAGSPRTASAADARERPRAAH